MSANIGDIRRLTESIFQREGNIANKLYAMTFSADSSQGAVREAIEHYNLADSEKIKAAQAAALGQTAVAAAHTAAAASAERLGRERAGNAGDLLADIALGLTVAGDEAGAARAEADVLVSHDDSSSAAAIHFGVDEQPQAMSALSESTAEIRQTVPDSRDTAALGRAADHIRLLRRDMDGQSGAAQGTATVAFDYLATLS